MVDMDDFDYGTDAYGGVSVCFFFKGEVKKSDCSATTFVTDKSQSSIQDIYCHVQVHMNWVIGNYVNAWTGGC